MKSMRRPENISDQTKTRTKPQANCFRIPLAKFHKIVYNEYDAIRKSNDRKEGLLYGKKEAAAPGR